MTADDCERRHGHGPECLAATVPASLWRPRLGEHVRVCVVPGTQHNDSSARHYPEEQGCTGWIVMTANLAEAADHPIMVVFNSPVTVFVGCRQLTFTANSYRVNELELIQA